MRKAQKEKFQRVLGFRWTLAIFYEAFAAATTFAACSQAEAHCLALEKSPLGRPYLVENFA